MTHVSPHLLQTVHVLPFSNPSYSPSSANSFFPNLILSQLPIHFFQISFYLNAYLFFLQIHLFLRQPTTANAVEATSSVDLGSDGSDLYSVLHSKTI